MERACLLGAEDGVLGGLGDAELDDALGRDLNLFPGGRIAADAGGTIHQDELAEPGQGESILGVLVGQIANDSRIWTACFLVSPFFSAIAAAICDFESAFAIVRIVCLMLFGFCLKSFDLARIKAL